MALPMNARPYAIFHMKYGIWHMAYGIWSFNIPHDVCGQRRPGQGPAVTEDGDQFVEVFDLQSVVEGEAKTMRPVKERQRADREQRQPRQRAPCQRQQAPVARLIDPTQRDSQAEQKEQDRNYQRGDHPAGAEERPQKWLIRSFGHVSYPPK